MKKSICMLLVTALLCCAGCTPAVQELAVTPPAVESTPTPAVAPTPAPMPDPLPAWLAQAAEAAENGDTKGAEALYLQAIAHAPQAEAPYLRYAALLLEESPLEALTVLEQGVLSLGGSTAEESRPLRQLWWENILGMQQQGGKITQKEEARLAELAYIGYTSPMVSTREIGKYTMLFAPYVYFSLPAKYTYVYDKQAGEEMPRYHDWVAYLPEVVKLENGWVRAVQTQEQAEEFVQDLYGIPIPEPREEFPPAQEGEDIEDGYFYCDGACYYYMLGDYIGGAFYLDGYTYLGNDLYYVTFGEDWLSTPSLTADPAIIPGSLHMVLQRSESAWGFTIRAIVRMGTATLLQADWPEMDILHPVENAVSSYPSERTGKQREADLPGYMEYLYERRGNRGGE